MKLRKGFVSNSSSSSYVCMICGNEVCGMDIGPSDGDMEECEDGHIFCIKHKTKQKSKLTTQQMIDRLLEWAYDDEMKEEIEEYKDNPDAIEEMYQEELYNQGADCPKEDCPICNLSYVLSEDMLTYVLKTIGKTKKAVEKEIKKKFSTLEELEKYENT